jgi:Fic family protein
MPAFFDLLREEPHPAVRVVLGHFIFVYIHPYMDGNGGGGRFLMNTMMASGGYPWTVIPVSDRNAYVNALEKESVCEDIRPFADFLAGLVKRRLAGEPLPAVPTASPVDERENNSRSTGSGEERSADGVHCLELRIDKNALRGRENISWRHSAISSQTPSHLRRVKSNDSSS